MLRPSERFAMLVVNRNAATQSAKAKLKKYIGCNIRKHWRNETTGIASLADTPVTCAKRCYPKRLIQTQCGKIEWAPTGEPFATIVADLHAHGHSARRAKFVATLGRVERKFVDAGTAPNQS